MSDDKDGMAKNWEVVKREWEDFKIAYAIAVGKAKRADGIGLKIHHLSGLGPDIHRLMPRTLWYGGWVIAGLIVMTGALYWWLV